MKPIKKTVEKYLELNEACLNHWLRKEKNSNPENEHPLNIEFYKVRQECYQAFIKDLNEILTKINILIEKKSYCSKTPLDLTLLSYKLAKLSFAKSKY